MEADREVALSELIDYLVSEPDKDSIVHAHTQNFGDIDLLLLSTTEYQEASYYLFCELDNSIPVTDASGVMHLIILRGNGDRGLAVVSDEDELDKIADEFYCILLAETDVPFEEEDNGSPTLEVESATEDLEIDGSLNSLLVDPSDLQDVDTDEKVLSDDDVL